MFGEGALFGFRFVEVVGGYLVGWWHLRERAAWGNLYPELHGGKCSRQRFCMECCSSEQILQLTCLGGWLSAWLSWLVTYYLAKPEAHFHTLISELLCSTCLWFLPHCRRRIWHWISDHSSPQRVSLLTFIQKKMIRGIVKLFEIVL